MRLLSQLAGCNTLSSSALQRAIILKRKHEKLISRSQPVSKCLKPRTNMGNDRSVQGQGSTRKPGRMQRTHETGRFRRLSRLRFVLFGLKRARTCLFLPQLVWLSIMAFVLKASCCPLIPFEFAEPNQIKPVFPVLRLHLCPCLLYLLNPLRCFVEPSRDAQTRYLRYKNFIPCRCQGDATKQ